MEEDGWNKHGEPWCNTIDGPQACNISFCGKKWCNFVIAPSLNV